MFPYMSPTLKGYIDDGYNYTFNTTKHSINPIETNYFRLFLIVTFYFISA